MYEINKEEFLKKIQIKENKQKKVWVVAIIGRPNVGKSTFINSLIWEKISITSRVPQTTRKRVLGIYNDEDSQIIFIDTPGVHIEDKVFNIEINKQATESLEEADLILYMIDTTREWGQEEKNIREIIWKISNPVIKVYTKIDLESKINIPVKEFTYNISSINKKWFPELLLAIKKHLKIWPLLYPEDYYTSQDMYFRISEIIREKVFLNTKEELPHSTYIEVSEIEEQWNLLKIVAYIYTETESQKYIIIGKNWSLISKIWKESRLDLEEIFERKVFLALRAKKKEKWRKDEGFVKKMFR